MEQENNIHSANKRGISGSTLKMIALITMLIDHIGAVVVLRMMFDNAAEMGFSGVILQDELYVIYEVMRSIGRIAFPIYCFLLVEGFQRTRNRTKYALRLGVFAVLSEIPFDLAFSSEILEFEYQNVFFTLFLGLITMLMVGMVEEVTLKSVNSFGQKIFSAVRWLMCLGIAVAGAVVAELFNTDYGAKGVLCIMVLYWFRKIKPMQMTAGCISFVWDGIAPISFVPIAFYNGERGLKLKYLFYMFYPLHLLILYLICVAMGINGYAVA